MPQTAPGAPGGAGLGLGAVGQQGAGDPNAAAAGQAQGQWPASDPNSYYSNYWGGKSPLSTPTTIANIIIAQDTMDSSQLANRVQQMDSTQVLLNI